MLHSSFYERQEESGGGSDHSVESKLVCSPGARSQSSSLGQPGKGKTTASMQPWHSVNCCFPTRCGLSARPVSASALSSLSRMHLFSDFGSKYLFVTDAVATWPFLGFLTPTLRNSFKSSSQRFFPSLFSPITLRSTLAGFSGAPGLSLNLTSCVSYLCDLGEITYRSISQ